MTTKPTPGDLGTKMITKISYPICCVSMPIGSVGVLAYVFHNVYYVDFGFVTIGYRREELKKEETK